MCGHQESGGGQRASELFAVPSTGMVSNKYGLVFHPTVSWLCSIPSLAQNIASVFSLDWFVRYIFKDIYARERFSFYFYYGTEFCWVYYSEVEVMVFEDL